METAVLSALARSTTETFTHRILNGFRVFAFLEFSALLGFLAALLACPTSLCATTPDTEDARVTESKWHPFESEEAGFRVLLPAAPAETSGSRRMWLGRIRNIRYRTRAAEGIELTVERHDVPRVARMFVGPASILARAEKGLLEDANARLLNSTEVSRHGFPGRRFTYEIRDRPGWIEEILLLLADNRLYVALAARMRGPNTDAPVARFFDSFEILATD